MRTLIDGRGPAFFFVKPASIGKAMSINFDWLFPVPSNTRGRAVIIIIPFCKIIIIPFCKIIATNLLMSLFCSLVARRGRKRGNRQTDRQTDIQDKYCSSNFKS